jgi:hypothetical protein
MNPNVNMQMNVLKPNCPQLLGVDWKSDTEMKYMDTETESIVIHKGNLFWARFPPKFQVAGIKYHQESIQKFNPF